VIRFGGHLATNSLTVAVSLLGLWFFARIVAKIELPNRALVVVASRSRRCCGSTA